MELPSEPMAVARGEGRPPVDQSGSELGSPTSGCGSGQNLSSEEDPARSTYGSDSPGGYKRGPQSLDGFGLDGCWVLVKKKYWRIYVHMIVWFKIHKANFKVSPRWGLTGSQWEGQLLRRGGS